MYKNNGKTIFSASDLADFIECTHLTALGLRSLDGESLPKKTADEATLRLQQQGIEHEQSYLKRLALSGKSARQIDSTGPANRQHCVGQILAALQEGVDAVYQAVFEARSEA